MKLLIGAGGTGGHIIPAIAIAKVMAEHGWQIDFIGNYDGMENRLVTQHGFAFHPINVQKIYRKLTLAHLKFPFLFCQSLFKCLSYIRTVNPVVVLCTGGFVSGPVALATVLSRKTLYFQDGNSFPGLTTRLLSRFTKHIFTATPVAKKYLPQADCIQTGNPLLPYKKTDKSSVDWTALNLSASSLKLFIIGGSQGSAFINSAVAKCVENLLSEGIEIIWQTGKNHKSSIQKQFGNHVGVHIFDFTEKMSFYYQIADLAISRAGALSLAELEEHRIPAVFIPLPSSAENHQLVNARTISEQGKGIVLEQSGLSSETLLDAIMNLKNDYGAFRKNLEVTPSNEATQKICDIIIREAKSRIESKCCPA